MKLPHPDLRPVQRKETCDSHGLAWPFDSQGNWGAESTLIVPRMRQKGRRKGWASHTSCSTRAQGSCGKVRFAKLAGRRRGTLPREAETWLHPGPSGQTRQPLRSPLALKSCLYKYEKPETSVSLALLDTFKKGGSC